MSSPIPIVVLLVSTAVVGLAILRRRFGAVWRARRRVIADRLGKRLWSVFALLARPSRAVAFVVGLFSLAVACHCVEGAARSIVDALVAVVALSSWVTARGRKVVSAQSSMVAASIADLIATDAIAQRAASLVALRDMSWIPPASAFASLMFLCAALVLACEGRGVDPFALIVRVSLRALDDGAPSDVAFRLRPEVRALTEKYRAEFARRGRVIISDLLEDSAARALADEVVGAAFKLECNSRVGLTYPGAPHCAGYLAIVFPERGCAREACKATCAFGVSALQGELRDFIREITSMPGLVNRSGKEQQPQLAIQAHPKGGYIAPHADAGFEDPDRLAVSMIWHATPEWDASFGGVLRFHRPIDGVREGEREVRTLRGYELDEAWPPRFNELHVFSLGHHQVHEVTLVTADAVRYTIASRLYERAEEA